MTIPDAEIRQFSCLSDNFGVLIHDPASGTTIAVDVPDAKPYLDILSESSWKLTDILITHHHWDHVQGLGELKKATNATVYGPARSRAKIPELDQTVEDCDHIKVGPLEFEALGTPGHTLDQISWYCPALKLAHTGDTLFSLGCGRVFEGDLEMMWSSLKKLKNRLPDDTILFCGHEYTAANAEFALTIEPDNAALQKRAKEVTDLRAVNQPTLPTNMAAEKATNPFLRADQDSVKAALGMEHKTDADVFAEIRTRKDNA
ncbi:hydroxyacylglutathione hydrolase [Roseibium hamelinense]|uniref:Hydroxyacylglutathione hydrolase n=1 Tax=Roseibium hamelinense TaxID=150831 RepID=A0A562SN39_9HYPH|nr:hydroxyacylglutathione hydrolase [Roseibium hamelinense]MTI44075.1 hydroxyacylglutathione hydrolase [Roseibium hamelinense]TWI82717.1 hydroxyacylglutathione hydrolase [Roseibium hamelinense]